MVGDVVGKRVTLDDMVGETDAWVHLAEANVVAARCRGAIERVWRLPCLGPVIQHGRRRIWHAS